MDLVARLGNRVFQRIGVITGLKSFGTVQLGYGIKKLDGRHYQSRFSLQGYCGIATVTYPEWSSRTLHHDLMFMFVRQCSSNIQREEELLTYWWKEYAECSKGPSGSCKISDTWVGNEELYVFEEESWCICKRRPL